MPRLNPYLRAKKVKLARKYFKEGLSPRQIKNLIGMSHEWINLQVRDMRPVDK